MAATMQKSKHEETVQNVECETYGPLPLTRLEVTIIFEIYIGDFCDSIKNKWMYLVISNVIKINCDKNQHN